MSRFGYAGCVSSDRSPQECLQAVRDCFLAIGCQPGAGANDMAISGKMGRGWAIRLVGGLIAPATWFPIRLTVSLHEKDGRREIAVHVEENFGIGSLIGIEEKARSRCDAVGQDLVRLLKHRLA